MSWVLDLANILGGFLLAVALLRQLPQVGDSLSGAAAALDRFRLPVAIACLVAGGYFLLVHLTSGPHVFHFELVGILVGIVLLLGARTASGTSGRRAAEPEAAAVTQDPRALLIAVLGIIAIVVGLQGLVTPN